MSTTPQKIIQATFIENNTALSLTEISIATRTQENFIIELVEHQILSPKGESQEEWAFDDICLRRARIAQSFYRDLEVNLAGLCLAFELIDKIDRLKKEINAL